MRNVYKYLSGNPKIYFNKYILEILEHKEGEDIRIKGSRADVAPRRRPESVREQGILIVSTQGCG